MIPGEPELEEAHLALPDFRGDDGWRGQEVARAQCQEDEADAGDVPSGVFPERKCWNLFDFLVETIQGWPDQVPNLHFFVRKNELTRIRAI